MADQQVAVLRTAVTMADYVRAVVRSWPRVGEGDPLEQSVAVLFAQYMVETGGQACWNWNIGNAKHFPGDGFDYHCLRGVWEGVSPAEAARIIASGEAIADPSVNHATAVGAHRVSVIFEPPHRQTWFRAFPSLDTAMGEHLQLLAKRYAPAWSWVLQGDVPGFANALKARGYFTADPKAYAAGMRPAFAALVASSTYEDLVATMHLEPETQAIEVPERDAMLWEEDWGSGGIVHAMPEWPSYRDS